MPSSAHAVAVATPCCPAPVSATTRVFPMRRASSTWPIALLILCAPVCARSSRLRNSRTPESSTARRASNSGVGRPTYVSRRRSSSRTNSASCRASKYAVVNLSTGAISVSGTNRPPNSPKYPRASGSRRPNDGPGERLLSMGSHHREELIDLRGVLDSRCCFESRGHVDAPGVHVGERLLHILRAQSASQNHRTPSAQHRRPGPVGAFACAATAHWIMRIDQHHDLGWQLRSAFHIVFAL